MKLDVSAVQALNLVPSPTDGKLIEASSDYRKHYSSTRYLANKFDHSDVAIR